MVEQTHNDEKTRARVRAVAAAVMAAIAGGVVVVPWLGAIAPVFAVVGLIEGVLAWRVADGGWRWMAAVATVIAAAALVVGTIVLIDAL